MEENHYPMDELKEKYLQGKLTEDEQRAFENDLSEKEAEELAFEMGIRDGLQNQIQSDLRKKVASFEHGAKRSKFTKPAYLSIAASVLIAVSFVFYFNREPRSLFDQYYSVLPNYELTTERGEEKATNRASAYIAYDNGNYSEAIAQFNNMDSLTTPDLLFRGISYIQEENYELALNDLERVINKQNQDYQDASKWYTSLLYLKLGRRSQATQLLEDLRAENSTYKIQANELLGKL